MWTGLRRLTCTPEEYPGLPFHDRSPHASRLARRRGPAVNGTETSVCISQHKNESEASATTDETAAGFQRPLRPYGRPEDHTYVGDDIHLDSFLPGRTDSSSGATRVHRLPESLPQRLSVSTSEQDRHPDGADDSVRERNPDQPRRAPSRTSRSRMSRSLLRRAT